MAALNALKSRMPEDLVPAATPPGASVSDPYKTNKWLMTMRDVAQQEKKSAASKYNLMVRQDRPNRDNAVPIRILSEEMFPSTVTVSYLDAPYLGYMAPSKPREVKFIVFHSYGHSWHATNMTGQKNWGGWLNDTRPETGAIPYSYEGKNVFIAKGSDLGTLSHPDRVNSAIQAAVGPNSRTCMHYLIDRSGNLTVIGDANFVMYSSDYANEFAISIGLEEAFYVTKHPIEEKARWSADGSPPGTGGNVQYFAFSPEQLLTLSILCKKLEVAFAIPQTINISRRSLTESSPPGYTMHDFIRGSAYVDVSPHFLTMDLWNAFFALVNTHTSINPTNVWKGIPKYVDSADALVTAPISDVPVERTTEIALEHSRYMGLGRSRALAKANISKNEVNDLAGKAALTKSSVLTATASNTYQFMQQEENLPVSLVEEELTPEEQGGWDDIWATEV